MKVYELPPEFTREIFNIIESLDHGKGADIIDILEEGYVRRYPDEAVNGAIKVLKDLGEAYEPNIGKISIVKETVA